MLTALKIAELIVFGSLAVQSVRMWMRRRSAATAWLGVTFVNLTLIVLTGLVVPREPTSVVSIFVLRVVVVGLLVFPFCLCRFTATFKTPSRWFTAAVIALTTLIVAPFATVVELGPDAPKPAWFAVWLPAFAAYWTLLSGVAARRLWREGRGRPTVARRRMTTLASGSVTLNVAVLVSIASNGQESGGLKLAVASLGLLSAVLFYAGFVVPTPLRMMWRRPEMEALRRGESELMAATTRDGVAHVILPHAAGLLGGGSAFILDEKRSVTARYGNDAVGEVASAVPNARPASGTVVEVGDQVVALALRDGWLAVKAGTSAPFFGRDELEVLETLGHLVDLAMERALLFDRLEKTVDELREQERQLGEAQRVAMVGSFEYDALTETIIWSEEMYRLLDVPRHAVPTRELYMERVHPDDREAVLAERDKESAEVEHRIVRRDGEVRTVRGSGRRVTRDDGRELYVGIIQDITEQKAAEAQMLHQALHDSLTDLPNRLLLMDRVEQALARSARSSRRPALLFVDLDRFKSINDAFGHRAGDEVLREVGRRLLRLIRAGDTVARLGGDEFVVLIEDAGDARQTLRHAERMARSVSQPLLFDGRELAVTCSIGVAIADAEGVDNESMLRDADMAMYRAKENGRSRVELFDAALRCRVLGQIDTERELRHGLTEHELRLYFQPCSSIETGTIVGLEALVRWQHPTRGLLPPSQFIELAESTGLVVELGRTVLREACRVGAQLYAEYGVDTPTVWVNLSARQLQRPGLAQMVAGALADAGLPGRYLGLELTETALMDNTATAGLELQAVRRLGVHLALDDFGTGFSSLSYLRKFPVDILKIDQSFVAGLGIDAEDTAIVNACVALAHSLGLAAVAEGVETVGQLEALRLIGCDRAQGFLLSEPLPAHEIGHVISQSIKPESSGTPLSLRRRPRVMVCDDDASVRLLLRVGLEGEGADVIEVSDADECVAQAKATSPDLVLLDVRMPGHDGFWALEQLNHAMPLTPVMLVTAAADRDVSENGVRLGAAGCFDKVGVLDRLPDLLGAVRTTPAPV